MRRDHGSQWKEVWVDKKGAVHRKGPAPRGELSVMVPLRMWHRPDEQLRRLLRRISLTYSVIHAMTGERV